MTDKNKQVTLRIPASERFRLMAMLAAGFLAALSPGTRAQDLQVMADSVFQPALKELAPLFAERTGTQVRLSLAPSAILAERLLAGESADVFFPAGDRLAEHPGKRI